MTPQPGEALCRLLVNERAAGRCELCHRPGESLHHRRKRSQGGLWRPSNILRLCGHGTAGCHGAIEAQPTTAGVLGLTVASYLDPATVPVACHPAGLFVAEWQPRDDGTWDWSADLDDTRAILLRLRVTDSRQHR